MNDIANNIKKNRNRLGLSQEELAERMHTTRQTISNWERGKSNPSTDDLVVLAEIFQISMDELIYSQRESVQGFWGRCPGKAAFGILCLVVVLRNLWGGYMEYMDCEQTEPIFWATVVLSLVVVGCARWIVLEIRKK